MVDDDPFIRKLVTTTLENVSHFTLLEAGDGVEALEVARRESPAIVFLNVDMPRKDGIETCRELRAEQAGADLFLTKLFSPLELLRLVDRLGGDVPA